MTLAELPFAPVSGSPEMKQCKIPAPLGELEIYYNVMLDGLYDIYLDYSDERRDSERWLDTDALTAQAVLFHLLPTE